MANDYFMPQRAIVHIPQPTILTKVSKSGIQLATSSLIPLGFTHGMPIKIRLMPECIVITLQNIAELIQCAEGLSVQDISEQQLWRWLHSYLGELFLEEEEI